MGGAGGSRRGAEGGELSVRGGGLFDGGEIGPLCWPGEQLMVGGVRGK